MNNEKMQVIESLVEYIPKLEFGIKEITECAQSGQENKFLEKIYYGLEGIEWVINATALTSDIHGINIDIINLNELFKEMLAGIENGDYILVCDIIEYEFLPQLEYWKDILIKSEKC